MLIQIREAIDNRIVPIKKSNTPVTTEIKISENTGIISDQLINHKNIKRMYDQLCDADNKKNIKPAESPIAMLLLP